MKALLKVSIFTCATLFASQASANIVVNGSFEAPDVPTGTWDVFNPIPGWTIGEGPGVEIRDNVAGTAFDGHQFAELDSDYATDTNSSIIQTLATSDGQAYNLSFAYSGRIGQPSETNNIQVFWNGSLLDDITATGGASHNWVTYDFLVTGTGSDELKFLAAGNDDQLGGSLDAVSVHAVQAVPVPAALPLMASALGLFGIARRRNV